MRLAAVVSVFAAFICVSFHSTAQSVAAFKFAEKPGPYAVGLKVVEQYDYARIFRHTTDALGQPYAGERARPLQTLVWYPAEKSSAKPMTVGDYAQLMATEISFGQPKLSASSKRRIEGMTPTLATSLWAVRDARLGTGRFPVVIYAPGASGWGWENADLCEYLASHGYVVIASPSMGASTRSMTIDAAGIDAQASDISYLIGYAQTLPDTDMSKVAVAAFSFGGMSNLFAAARDNRIRALVALDGSSRYYPALLKQVGDLHPEQMTTPLLFFTSGEITLEDQMRYFPEASQGPNVLNAWTHGDLLAMHMAGLAHVEFSAMNQRSEDVWKNSILKDGYGREYGSEGYAWVARYTLQFLDAYLKHEAAAMAYLKKTPAENGVPAHFITMNYRPAQGMPPSLDAFRSELGRQGFDHAADVYASMQKDNPGFKLDRNALDHWAYELMADYHLPEAINLLQLNARNYPDSGDVYDSLADAYMRSGNKTLAIENYSKSLEKDPNNANATIKLKQLRGSAPTTK